MTQVTLCTECGISKAVAEHYHETLCARDDEYDTSGPISVPPPVRGHTWLTVDEDLLIPARMVEDAAGTRHHTPTSPSGWLALVQQIHTNADAIRQAAWSRYRGLVS